MSYRVPRALPAPNVARLVRRPPPTGSPLWRLVNVLSELNVHLYRVSGGRIGGRMSRASVLLLHHVGRKSGKERVSPVLFLADGERLVVVGSKGGATANPAWVHNLRAHPETTVEIARERVRVRAREATDDEREAFWPRLVASYPSYEVYRRRTDRRFPIFVLEPVRDG